MLPADFDQWTNVTYIEPFIGGGAMLFHMLQTHPNISRAIINDINPKLTNCYRVIKEKPSELINLLRKYQDEYFSLTSEETRKEYYLRRRDEFNSPQNDIVLAGLFIFINRTCFNGLYRENRKGIYNVPFGKTENPTICDAETILADNALLQNVEILTGQYFQTLPFANGRTIFYFDPPYRPLSDTSSFNDYTKQPFNDDAQIHLKQFCDTVHEKGFHFMLSNSDCLGKNETDRFFDDLYKDYNIGRVWARRSVNSIASKRGKLTELLIRNYDSEYNNIFHQTI